MELYIGTKFIEAKPGTYADFLMEFGAVPNGKTELTAEGYIVKYEDGYISWSPKATFESAYRSNKGLTFGMAIEFMKKGYSVAREAWNGTGMYIVMMPSLYLPPYNTQGTARKVNDRTAKWIGEDTPLDSQPYIAMFTAKKQWQPGWLASQADMLSDDWLIVKEGTNGSEKENG